MTDEYAVFDFDAVDFVTSDTHFSHARISELAGRPFTSVQEMDAEMIRRWNDTVGADDVVLHLGDVALGPIDQSIPLTAQLNGRRLLVPGNHDRVSPATQSRRAIERFAPIYEQAGWILLPEIVQGTRGGRRLIASHYPYSGDTQDVERHSSHRPVDRGVPLLHGHTHDRNRGPSGHQFHVGVDAFDYAPIPMSLVDAWLQRLERKLHDEEAPSLGRHIDEQSIAEGTAMVRDALRQVWTDPVIDVWLTSANGHLDGARPVDVLALNDLAAVLKAVRQEAEGGYR